MHKRTTQMGRVVSVAMDKSVVVRVDHIMRHDQYKKYIKRSKRFMAHDETNQCNLGDKVEIFSIRPISKHKRWRVSRVIEKGQEVMP